MAASTCRARVMSASRAPVADARAEYLLWSRTWETLVHALGLPDLAPRAEVLR